MTDKNLLSYVRRAIQDYDMITAGDTIAVGISGGKDSLCLLIALTKLSRFYPLPFSVKAVTIDLGFGADFEGARKLCAALGVEYSVVPTQIGRVVFEERHEKNPCSLCSKMRRGALSREAVRLGCNKLALGHHRDDAVETLFLNLFYAGRLATFEPKSYLDRRELTLIRPLLYLPEKELAYYCKKRGIAPDASGCPADAHTERERVKTLLHSLSGTNRDLYAKVFGAITRAELCGYRRTQDLDRL